MTLSKLQPMILQVIQFFSIATFGETFAYWLYWYICTIAHGNPEEK